MRQQQGRRSFLLSREDFHGQDTGGRSSSTKCLTLQAATLPTHLYVFRLEDFFTVIVCTERLVEASQRLGLDGVRIHPLRTK